MISRVVYINHGTFVKNEIDLYLAMEQSLRNLGMWGAESILPLVLKYRSSFTCIHSEGLTRSGKNYIHRGELGELEAKAGRRSS